MAPNTGAAALAAEWFTGYAEYLRRAAGQSADTIELYQQVTDCIARGDLVPTAAPEMLTAFAQTRGTAYADQLTQLSMRFFSEMARISTIYAHGLGQAVLPEAAPFPLPPAFDPSDPVRWFQQLTDSSHQLSATVTAAHRALLDRVAAGEVAPGRIEEAANGYLQRSLPAYLSELSRVYFDLLTGLTELRARMEHEFLAGMLEGANGTNGTRSFELVLEAPLGDTATASLSIANTRDELARIRYHVTDIRRADAVGPAFTPDVTFVPEELELAPGDEASLTLALRLHERSFAPGVRYTGTLRVTGHGDPRLEIPLRITATEPVATTPP